MAEDPPNVLFLISDQHNYRCTGFGSTPARPPVRTPNLDRLAEASTVFGQAYCQSPVCAPSRIAMLTGRRVTDAGAWKNGSVLSPDQQTIPGVFRDAGYETCLVGKMHLGGTRQKVGFNHRPYGDLTGEAGHQHEPVETSLNITKGLGKDTASTKYTAGSRKHHVLDAGITEYPESLLQEQNVLRESTAFLREHTHANPDQPWFLCASFSRPHTPFTAPERHFDEYWPDVVTPPSISNGFHGPLSENLAEWYDTEGLSTEQVLRARAAYFASVSYLDEIIDDFLSLLEESGFLDDTIIVYTSDHGEMMGEHRLWEKRTWHEDSARVPLLIQTPEQRASVSPGARIDTPVSLADLFPTLADLAEASYPDDLEGRSLRHSVATGEEPEARPIVYEYLYPRFGDATMYRAVRSENYKLINFEGHDDLLFDLEADPNEQANLADQPTEEHERVIAELREVAEGSHSFDEILSRREADEKEAKAYTLPIATGHANAYHMPDGRIVDADTPLYQPNVLTDDATKIFYEDRSRESDF